MRMFHLSVLWTGATGRMRNATYIKYFLGNIAIALNEILVK